MQRSFSGHTQNGGSSESVGMIQYPDGSWCCASSNTTCCGSKLGIQLAIAIPPYVCPTSTSRSPGSSSSGASPGLSLTESCAPDANKSSSSNGTTIGLGAALGVAVIALPVVSLFLWKGARRMGSKPIAELVHHCQGHYPDPKLGYPAQLQSPGFRLEVSAEDSKIRLVGMDGRVDYRN
ncbi:hypothetical protein BGZ57DRAFT_186541 [Hyaloscypha finlandica]|nr:hypothetical protein BGZ57DRAFT_186541 [Hyaloscypha finlandica]